MAEQNFQSNYSGSGNGIAAASAVESDLTIPQADIPPSTAAKDIRVDLTDLKSSYCNVCNINSTREEVVLNFGANHDWDRSRSGEVKLLHRVILSPYAAKRVADLLKRVVADYEARYGTLT